MNGDSRRRRDVGGGDELLRALRSLGEGYEPDLTAIQHRMRSSSSQHGVIEHGVIERSVIEHGVIEHTPRLQAGHPGSRAANRSRRGWLTRPVMLPIAAAILVFGGIVALMPHHNPTRSPARAAIGPAGAVSATTGIPTPTAPPTSSSDLPSRLGPAVSATEKSSAPSTSTDPGQPTMSDAPQPSVGVWPVSPRVPMHETLSMFGRYDWIALGARSDHQQVRASQSARSPQIYVNQPDNADVVFGPFRLSWDQGVPEDHRTDEGTWLRADGVTGWSMTLMPSATTVRRLQLYMGTTNLKAFVEVSGKDFATQRLALQESGSTPSPMIVELNIPRTSHHVFLHFSGTATGAGNAPSGQSNFYLAGLTLRTNNQETAATK